MKDANSSPALIAIGGFPGVGKTTLARRLAADLHIPRLSSDEIAQTIKKSTGANNAEIQATRIGYDLLFRLCEDFISAGVTTVVDMNLGWDFHWRSLDQIVTEHPQTLLLPIVLRCPHELCLQRAEARHRAAPAKWEPAEYYATEQKVLDIANYLRDLDRPDIHYIDAARDKPQVYSATIEYLRGHLESPDNK